MARAYRCKVKIEGECFGVPDSSRAIADCVVPTRAANSACVRPEAARALNCLNVLVNSDSRLLHDPSASRYLRERHKDLD